MALKEQKYLSQIREESCRDLKYTDLLRQIKRQKEELLGHVSDHKADCDIWSLEVKNEQDCREKCESELLELKEQNIHLQETLSNVTSLHRNECNKSLMLHETVISLRYKNESLKENVNELYGALNSYIQTDNLKRSEVTKSHMQEVKNCGMMSRQ